MFQTRVPSVARGSHRVSHDTGTPALRRFEKVTIWGQQVTIRNLEPPAPGQRGRIHLWAQLVQSDSAEENFKIDHVLIGAAAVLTGSKVELHRSTLHIRLPQTGHPFA